MKKKVIIVSVILVILIVTGITYIVLNKEEKNKDNQKCDSSVECCSGNTYPDNPNCEDKTSEETRTKLEIDEEILNLAKTSFLGCSKLGSSDYLKVSSYYSEGYSAYNNFVLTYIYKNKKTQISELPEEAKLNLAVLNLCGTKLLNGIDICEVILADELNVEYKKLFEKENTTKLPDVLHTSCFTTYDLDTNNGKYSVRARGVETPISTIEHYIVNAYKTESENANRIEIYERVAFNYQDYEDTSDNLGYEFYIKSYKDVEQTNFVVELHNLEVTEYKLFEPYMRKNYNNFSLYKHTYILNDYNEYIYISSEIIE